MKTNYSPIGIFDSGVGGLSILKSLKKLLPNESFVYVADQKYAPYGTKTKPQIKKRALIISEFLKKKNCKVIIIACNTATIASIDTVRSKIKLPVIGVVPVIKTAAQITKSKKIIILATPSTVKSNYLNNLIKKFAKDITVYKNGATGIENIIETGKINSQKIDAILKKSLSNFFSKNIDTVVLGCTHYPFIKKNVKKIVGKNVAVIDSSEAVARHTKRILKKENLLSYEKGQDLYYTTKNKKAFEKTYSKLIGEKVTAYQIGL